MARGDGDVTRKTPENPPVDSEQTPTSPAKPALRKAAPSEESLDAPDESPPTPAATPAPAPTSQKSTPIKPKPPSSTAPAKKAPAKGAPVKVSADTTIALAETTAATAVTEDAQAAPDGAEEAAEGAEVVTHRRRPGLLLPVLVMLGLVIAALAIGAYVVPEKGPNAGAAPPAGTATSGPTAEESDDTSGPRLPTAPPRPADQLADWAGRVGGAVDVPPVAMQAYAYAQLSLQQMDPGCSLGWTTLAGVAEVESHHGQAGGAVLEKTGRSNPQLLGPALDGGGGRPLVRDSDAGAFDGDPNFDHTMGPMRLLPSQWRSYAIDADGDGINDPYDIDDSALALGRLLCSGTEDLGQLPGWNTAIGRLHTGAAYAKSVFTAADSYGQRTRSIG
jgi:hypothetical protein